MKRPQSLDVSAESTEKLGVLFLLLCLLIDLPHHLTEVCRLCGSPINRVALLLERGNLLRHIVAKRLEGTEFLLCVRDFSTNLLDMLHNVLELIHPLLCIADPST